VQVSHSQVSDAHVAGDVAGAIQALLALGPQVVVEKRGQNGARGICPEPYRNDNKNRNSTRQHHA